MRDKFFLFFLQHAVVPRQLGTFLVTIAFVRAQRLDQSVVKIRRPDLLESSTPTDSLVDLETVLEMELKLNRR